MPNSSIEAITFDVGGTLIHPWPSVGHVYSLVAARNGHHGLAPSELNRRFIGVWRERGEFNHTFQAWGQIVDRTFSGLVATPPTKSFFPELYREFAKPDSWRLYDDVIQTLEELASLGIPMAIVSNWDERLRPLLNSLKLSGYFETMLISSELYFAKPSNVIFDHALRSLGAPAEAVLHVGDSVSEDVNGARMSGLQAVLIDRLGTPEHGRITSLAEIPKLLACPR